MVRIAQFVCYISKNSKLGWAKTIKDWLHFI